jgi:hypothetical protein
MGEQSLSNQALGADDPPDASHRVARPAVLDERLGRYAGQDLAISTP